MAFALQVSCANLKINYIVEFFANFSCHSSFFNKEILQKGKKLILMAPGLLVTHCQITNKLGTKG